MPEPPAPRFAAVVDLPVLEAEEMRRWDTAATGAGGVPVRVLIEAAGRAVAAFVQREFPDGRVIAAVGAGHNGADALVALRVLRAWGRDVAAVFTGERHPDAALLHGWEVAELDLARDADALRTSGVLLDGILGTGARGAPRPERARLIEALNGAVRPIIALDGPSGVDLTTGACAAQAVRATATVCFGALKRGLLLFPGREMAGRLVVAEIGLPPLGPPAGALLVTPAWAARRLPPMRPNAHKGQMGLVSIVAGHPGMAGAAVLAGLGALRGGAGKARLVSPDANRTILQATVPEALYVDRDGADAAEVAGRADALVAGPGMGTEPADADFLRAVLECARCPVLLDADALTLLSREPALRELVQGPLLLTPHPGELARLLGTESGAITADPFAAATRAAERFGCAVLLKGAPSLVAAPGIATRVNVAGHAGIATGGMGDVLSGLAGALLATGVAPENAGALALLFAGRAAEIAGRGRALLPRDVLDALPDALGDSEGNAPPLAPGILLDLHPAY